MYIFTFHVHGGITMTLNHAVVAPVSGVIGLVHWSPWRQRGVIISMALHATTHGAIRSVGCRGESGVRGSKEHNQKRQLYQHVCHNTAGYREGPRLVTIH